MKANFSFSSSDRRRSLRMNASSMRLSVPGLDRPIPLRDLSEFSIATEPVGPTGFEPGQHLSATLILPDGQVIENLHLGVYRVDGTGVVLFFEDMPPQTVKALDGLYWDEVSTCITPDDVGK